MGEKIRRFVFENFVKTCRELDIRLVAKQESLLLIEELEKSSTTENKIHPEIVVSILERI